MKLTIIIVNYNTGHLLKECLESIYSTVKGDDFCKVIVVDNNSTDGSVNLIKKFFLRVELIENHENIGFARANNQAIKVSKSQYVLLLNPDTVVQHDAIFKMVHFMNTNPRAGVLGCRILNPDGSLQPSCKRFPTQLGEFLQNTFLDRLLPIDRVSGRFSIMGWKHDEVRDVDWATGACLMVRKKTIDEVRLLDERYFLYYEEVDWCYRIKQLGWRVCFIPDAQIIHYQAQSTEQYLDMSLVESYKSHYYFFKKHYGGNSLSFFRYFTRMGARLRIYVWSLSYIFKKKRVESKQRIKAYRTILQIKKEPQIGLDISCISRSKAGVGCYTRSLIRKLSEIDKDGVYAFFSYKERRSGRKKTVKARMFHKVYGALRHTIWEQLLLPLNLFIRGIDLIHSPAYVTPMMKSCPTIITVHDMAYLLYPDKFVKAYRLYLKFWVPLSVKRADIVVTDSIQSKRDIVKLLKVPEEKVEVIYLGVSELFRPVSDDEKLDAIRRKYNLPQEFILYVGTIEPRKNIIELIYAYGEFKKKVGDTVKIVIGGKMGWLYDNIFEAIEGLGLKEDVIFTGYIADEDLPLVYNAAKVFVYPSLYEGFGLPPLEAMACGVPVVTSNTSSLPELVNGAGIMVNPDNPHELAEAIYNVLTNEELRKKMIKRGLEKAKKFTWEKTAKKTLEVYEKVLSRT